MIYGCRGEAESDSMFQSSILASPYRKHKIFPSFSSNKIFPIAN
jgi:hypothetical protein